MSTVYNCPSCGVTLRVAAMGAGSGGSGGWQAGRSFAFGAGKLPAGASEYSREVPAANLASVESGAKLPMIQAGITAAVALALAVIIGLARGWPWTHPPVIGVVVFSLAWWVLLIQSRQLLSSREVVTADPGTGEQTFSVEITEKLPERQRVQYAHFPARRPEVERFAMAALNDWLTVNSPHRLSRRKFTQLRDVALDRGLLSWRCAEARQQGCELTAVGRHVFKRLIAGA